jgi:DNA primase
VPVRSPGRRAPAAAADLAFRLLLRHSDWWARLPGADHDLLHSLGGAHGQAAAWLDQQITEHGDLSWGTLEPLLQGQEWAEDARAWMRGAADDEEQSFEDLQRVMRSLLIDRLEAQTKAVIGTGATDAQTKQHLRELLEQIKQLKAANRPPAPGNA